MNSRPASLAMYDADPAAAEAWWDELAARFEALGVAGVPARLDWPPDLDRHWREPRLLLAQTCGLPLVTRLHSVLRVVGAFRYDAPHCTGIDYRSSLVARIGDPLALADYRGRVAAVNAPDSHSGCNALRGAVAALAVDGRFFKAWHVTGSHRRSLAALRSGAADLAAIDCITLAGLQRQDPETLQGLRVIAMTEPAPGLPLVTSAGTSDLELLALRQALAAACRDPATAALRAPLFIGGFEAVPASAWQVVAEVRARAARALPNEPVVVPGG